MPRTIAVKGTGEISARPDCVIVSMNIESRDKNYDKAISGASENIDRITQALTDIGFNKTDLKTSDFRVNTEYSYEGEPRRRAFDTYSVSHRLHIEFPFDNKRISETLSAVDGSGAAPELSIRFTVKDTEKIKDELLRSAAENARRKAEILCEASGVKLGKLINIEYNWSTIEICSPTSYGSNSLVPSGTALLRSFDIEPDDIKVSDSAAFIWEIE